MKRCSLICAAIFLISFGAVQAYRGLASDETKIRRLLLETAMSFNAGSREGCLAAFHSDYKDDSLVVIGKRRLDRSTLGQALMYVLHRERDAETSAFRLRVGFGEGESSAEDLEDWSIAVDGARALAEFNLRFDRWKAGNWEPVWGVSVSANLRRDEGLWTVVGSSTETVSGRRPY